MRHNYLTRAMKARDPRFARIASKLGYDTTAMAVGEPVPTRVRNPYEITMLRAEYERVIGKKPFNGWQAETLRKKIAEAKKG